MRRAAALTAFAVIVLSGCGPSGPAPAVSDGVVGSIEFITIGLSDTQAPALDFEVGLSYSRAETRVAWEGEGEALIAGQPLFLDIYGQSLEDGSVMINTFDGLAQPYLLAPELLGRDLYEALRDVNVGARILHVAPGSPKNAQEHSIAFVIDVLPTRASGTPVEPRDDLPIVVLGDRGEPQITMRTGVAPPVDLQVATLIRGSGAQIREGSYISVNYKAVLFAGGRLFDSSWAVEKAPLETQIGVGAVIQGWDRGLIDQTAGSQVLLITPPSLAYPDQGTLVFVIDILDVWNPEE